MKVIGTISTAVLSLLLGTAAPAYAQHEEHAQQKEHAQQQHAQASQSAQHEQHAQQAKPAHQQHAQKSKSSAQHEQHAQKSKPSTSRPARKQQAAQRGDHDRGRRIPEEHFRGRRIPEEHFRANFGREHSFQINRPTIVEGVPRFQYGGYWFGFYDPWPVGWYYTDDVYVDFIGGGYYLFNPRHPGIRLAIRVF